MGSVHKRPGRDGWYLSYYNGEGKQVRTKAPYPKKSDNVTYLAELEANEGKVKRGVAAPITNDRDLAALLKSFLQHQEVMGKRPATVEHYKYRVGQFLDTARVSNVIDLKPRVVSRFIEIRQAEDSSPRSINACIGASQTMLRWAVRQELIGRNPLQHVDKVPSRNVKDRRALTDNEVRALLDCEGVPGERRRVWTAFLTTGLRSNELRQWCWSWFDDKSAPTQFTIPASVAKVNRRDGSEDVLPVAPELAEVLATERARAGDDPDDGALVFSDPHRKDGLPYTKRHLRDLLARDLKAAGIQDRDSVDVHSLRRTYGTMLAGDASNDIRTVMSLMRHTTVQMTFGLYAAPRVQNQRRAVQSLRLASRGQPATVAAHA